LVWLGGWVSCFDPEFGLIVKRADPVRGRHRPKAKNPQESTKFLIPQRPVPASDRIGPLHYQTKFRIETTNPTTQPNQTKPIQPPNHPTTQPNQTKPIQPPNQTKPNKTKPASSLHIHEILFANKGIYQELTYLASLALYLMYSGSCRTRYITCLTQRELGAVCLSRVANVRLGAWSK